MRASPALETHGVTSQMVGAWLHDTTCHQEHHTVIWIKEFYGARHSIHLLAYGHKVEWLLHISVKQP